MNRAFKVIMSYTFSLHVAAVILNHRFLLVNRLFMKSRSFLSYFSFPALHLPWRKKKMKHTRQAHFSNYFLEKVKLAAGWCGRSLIEAGEALHIRWETCGFG